MKYLFLIFVFAGCADSPEQLKLADKENEECVKSCTEIGHQTLNVNFWGCHCGAKK